MNQACEKWIDVRSFGQVFVLRNEKLTVEIKEVSVGVRGPVTIHILFPLNLLQLRIFK